MNIRRSTGAGLGVGAGVAVGDGVGAAVGVGDGVSRGVGVFAGEGEASVQCAYGHARLRSATSRRLLRALHGPG